jgi:hypothetical protein
MNKVAISTALPLVALSLTFACASEAPPPAAAPASGAAPAAGPPASSTIDSTPIADPVANVPPTCKNGVKPAANGLIDDLEDGNAQGALQGGRDGSWFVGKGEHAVVTLPLADNKPSAGGSAGGKFGMHFTGKTDNSDTWGAALGINFLATGKFYDASKYAGIAFKIKSSKPNTDVRFKVLDVNTHPDGGGCSKQCFNAFGRELILGTEWRDVKLMWSELTQQSDWGDIRPPMIDFTKVKDLEWQLWPGVDFDVWVDDVQLLECQ